MDETALFHVFDEVVRRFECHVMPPAPEASAYFPWIGLHLRSFFSELDIAMEHAPGKWFLDVGSGVGTKLMIMDELGFRTFGIERHKPYIELSRALVPEALIYEGDAFDVPVFDASICYMYRPAMAQTLQANLEAHVIAGMLPGCILYLPASGLHAQDQPLEQISEKVWRRI